MSVTLPDNTTQDAATYKAAIDAAAADHETRITAAETDIIDNALQAVSIHEFVESLDHWTTGGTGTVTYSAGNVVVSENATAKHTLGEAHLSPLSWSRRCLLVLPIDSVTRLEETGDRISIYLGDPAGANLRIDITFQSFSGNFLFTGRADDGAAQSSTSGLSSATPAATVAILFTPGEEAEFFVDGTSIGTVAANLPTGAYPSTPLTVETVDVDATFGSMTCRFGEFRYTAI